MSLEDAEKFYQRRKEDEELNEKVKKLSIDDLAIYAKKLGFNFTREEMVKTIEENEVDNEFPLFISDALCLTDFPEVIINFPAQFQMAEEGTDNLSDLARRLIGEE